LIISDAPIGPYDNTVLVDIDKATENPFVEAGRIRLMIDLPIETTSPGVERTRSKICPILLVGELSGCSVNKSDVGLKGYANV
jgi:hypothetical protein